MAALIKKKKDLSYLLSYEGQLSECRLEIERLSMEYITIAQQLRSQKRKCADLILHHETGFHIGDTALYPVPAGRTVKEKTCVIEWEDGKLFVRPVNEGTASTRHFYLYEGNFNLLKAVK